MAHQEIEHTQLPVRGINLHVAQVGKGELGTVVFLHGFPEIWYSWRHQMLAVAAAGYRAIAPDCRGYGLSDQPPENEEDSWVWDDLVADVLSILDALSIPKAFLVGKDFGAMPAYEFALQHPDRTCGVVCLGIPFSPVPFSFDTMPEGFYVLHWGEPGRAEADFGRYDVRRVVRTVYVLFSGAEIPIAKEGQEIMDLADLSTPLPEWFTEEDLDVYAKLYEKSGFRYPLQMPYRSIHKMPNRLDAKFQAPVLMVMGEKDYCFKFPGFETALRSGVMDNFMPDLKITYIPEGSHFVQEQLPEQVNELLLDFLKAKGPTPLHRELGTVVFLHGFPEIWYSWRHQMLAVAAAGYRAIAPDCRGYGLSDQPQENEEDSWVWDDLVADVLSILDALSIPKLQFKSSILDSYTYPESIETNRMLCIQCESSSLNGLLGPALVHC